MSSVLLIKWKEEPASPLNSDGVTWLSDEDFYPNNDQEQDYFKIEEDLFESCDTKAEVASQILENLENLVDLDELIKEEPYLLDVKMLPILDEVEPVPLTPLNPVKIEQCKPPTDTQFLLNEFQNVMNVMEYNQYHSLTPPQSPPSEPPVLTILEPILNTPTYTPLPPTPPEKQPPPPQFCVPEKQLFPNVFVNYRPAEYPAAVTPQPTDIAHELAVVDEIVRSRVEDMQLTSSGPSSPCSNSSSSCSNFGDCSSDDPEWMPESVAPYPTQILDKSPRKRSKPYSRNVEDKKSRKKEQNKNAATRYRMKKKAEVEEILAEERELMKDSDNLNNKIVDLQREIKYLKGLMRDLFKAKGLIN